MEEKEILQKLVNESNSLSEIIRKLGKSVSGDAVNLLKEKLKLYDIKYNFSSSSRINNLNKKPLSYYLTVNSNCYSNNLKRRLIQEGLKENKCEMCGISSWNGKELTLQLHHINGIHNDNRIENLQILCPNCHSQTDTYGCKKHKKLCPNCGKVINSRSKYCMRCAAIERHKRNAGLV